MCIKAEMPQYPITMNKKISEISNTNIFNQWKQYSTMLAILSAYPLARNDPHPTRLLLANIENVDRDKLKRQCCGMVLVFVYLNSSNINQFIQQIDSFLIDRYRDLFNKLSQRCKIHSALLDSNLTQLRSCIQKRVRLRSFIYEISCKKATLSFRFFLDEV